jgi:hypothetical protein
MFANSPRHARIESLQGERWSRCMPAAPRVVSSCRCRLRVAVTANLLFRLDLTRVPLCLGPMLETCSERFTRRGCPGAAARTITLAIKCGVVRLLCRRLYPQCRSAPFTSLLTQGSHLMVQGAVRSREYQRDGVKHRVFELRAGTKAISSLTRARADASSGAGLKRTDPARFTGTRSCGLMSYRHQP